MYLGIDFGTSGCRAIIIDEQDNPVAEVSYPLPSPKVNGRHVTQHADVWISGLHRLFKALAAESDLSLIKRIAIDGTSASLLMTDENGLPLTPALMYNDSSSYDEVLLIKHHCPSSDHLSMTATSSLAKAIQLKALQKNQKVKFLHQADYLTNYLCDDWDNSDYHNALKLGFDVKTGQWPEWIFKLIPEACLPKVFSPGEVIGRISTQISDDFGFSPECEICAGTTDANAAFIATGCQQLGDAVTSLGNTMVLKVLNLKPVHNLATGVYSHKLGDYWLCGGASNAGAAILRQFFSDQELIELSAQIDLQKPTALSYYPLPSPGERFPVNDPNKKPELEPRPESDVDFLHGILSALTQIEHQGYEKLKQLGASAPNRILSCGGGASNPIWLKMRNQLLGVPVLRARQTQAAYGSALLAKQGLSKYIRT